MNRRSFLKMSSALAVGSALPKPSIAKGSKTTLVVVPENNLAILDPIVTTIAITNSHGYAVFDTLYGVDDHLQPRPQMAAGHDASADRREWTVKLRDGLKFHDKEPVLARDCVASIKRWSERDTYGRTLAAFLDTMEATDDKTIRFRFKQPFSVLPNALGHHSASACFIMPERIAKSDPMLPVKEMVGSGPFRYLADEFVAGAHVAYAKFDGYAPRDEPAQGTAGGKRVYFDRVEWKIIPDAATAAAALKSGEVDWWQYANPDLIPMLKGDANIRVEETEPNGNLLCFRFNCANAPFDKPEIRRIVTSAVTQGDFMEGIFGAQEDGNWSECSAIFPCGLPGVEEVAKGMMGGAKDLKKLAAELKAAGYNGEKIVILQPMDVFQLKATGDILADLLTKLGMNVDLQAMDLGTFTQRRAKSGPVQEGGWSIFPTYGPAATIADPGINFLLRGLGEKGFPGNYRNAEIEALAAKWISASDPKDANRLVTDMQREFFTGPATVPLGRYLSRTAYRRDLTDRVKVTNMVFWNIRRA